MVQALVSLDEQTNRVLNVVKAKYGFRDKAQAIEFVVSRFVEHEEPDLRPEFIQKMKRIAKEPRINVKNLREHYGVRNVRT